MNVYSNKNIRKWIAFFVSFLNVSFSLMVLSFPVLLVISLIIASMLKTHLDTTMTFVLFTPVVLVLLKFFLVSNQSAVALAEKEFGEGETIDLNNVNDDQTSERIRLAFNAARNKLGMHDYKIILIRSKINVFNAFAISSLSDNVVVVFDGLTNMVDNEKLIAVIGHELGHIKNKDSIHKTFLYAIQYFIPFAAIFSDWVVVSLHNIFTSLKNSAFVLLGISILLVFRIIFQVVKVSLWLNRFINAYAFKQSEYMADQIGSLASSKEAMVGILEDIHSLGENQNNGSAFYILLAEHPRTSSRIKNVLSN